MPYPLKNLLETADRITVDAVCQPPYCADLRTTSPRPTYEHATAEGFTYLPVREADGSIRRLVRTEDLAHLEAWDDLSADLDPIGVDDLVARDAPILSLLDRLARVDRPLLLCLGRDGVDAVVTVYDLNQPSAHLFSFGLALVVEGKVGEYLTQHFGDDLDRLEASAERALSRNDRSLKAWRTARRRSEHLDLAPSLTFDAKLKLLEQDGFAEFSRRYGPLVGRENADLLSALHGVRKLRNAVGHADEEMLPDHDWMAEHMRLTHRLADALAQ